MNTTRLADIETVSEAERSARLRALGACTAQPLNGEVSQIKSRIADLESRYEKSSDRMLAELQSGQISETADIAHWLMLLKIRDRLGQTA